MAERSAPRRIRADVLARTIGAELVGDGALELDGVASLEQATPTQLAFYADDRHAATAAASRAGAVILKRGLALGSQALRMEAAHPKIAFARALEAFHPQRRPAAGIHRTAIVAGSARVGNNVHVGAYAVVGERVVLGDDVVVHPHVTIYDDAVLGARTIVHAHAVVREAVRIGADGVLQPGAVIGADGFGYDMSPEGHWYPVLQVGTVEIGDKVEVGANACIDRATLDATVVGAGTKIDNLAQIGHNCAIGADSLLCGQVGLAGSTTVGRRVVLGGQAGIAGHLTIGDGANVAGGSGVIADLEGGKNYGGIPAQEFRAAALSYVMLHNLPALVKRVRALERRLGTETPAEEPA